MFLNLYSDFTGITESFEEIAYQSKRFILQTSFVSEVTQLGNLLFLLAKSHRSFRDYLKRYWERALIEFLSSLPVYRSYITARTSPSEDDRKHIAATETIAKSRNPSIDAPVFEFISSLLLHSSQRSELGEKFVSKFQQLSGPATAKGIEDTALYRYCPLVSLNEVGGNPSLFGTELSSFHEWNLLRAKRW
jgi:(1->4)-alpha-D-glucan 1-alpha-D-glucosylmutase